MTFPQTHSGHSPTELTSDWPYLWVKDRFPLQWSGKNLALVVSFQTTPSPVSNFCVSFFLSLCFSPFTVRLFCLLCSMWAARDASKLVKPESEAHSPVFTQEIVCKKTSVIRLLRHLYNSLHILVYLEPGYTAIVEMCEGFRDTHLSMFTGTSIGLMFP